MWKVKEEGADNNIFTYETGHDRKWQRSA